MLCLFTIDPFKEYTFTIKAETETIGFGPISNVSCKTKESSKYSFIFLY